MFRDDFTKMLKMYLQKGIAAAAAAVMLVCSVSLEAFADSSVPESTAHKVFLAISAGTNMRWVPDDDSSAAKKNSTTGKDAVITVIQSALQSTAAQIL